MPRNFTRKGHGRIFVDKIENIQVVKDEIKDMDSFEYDYLPKDFIVPFAPYYPNLVYTHKFDSLDLDYLIVRLWKKKIHIFCLDNGHNGDYFTEETILHLTKDNN